MQSRTGRQIRDFPQGYALRSSRLRRHRLILIDARFSSCLPRSTDHPIATKRVLRVILKATDQCATEPARVARQIVEGGFTPRYDYALQAFKELPYDKWRQYDPEDTMRFYALRLHEAGLIKSSPNKIIAEATDWRFLNELKHELKT